VIRVMAIAFALLAVAACGKYGPPVRSAGAASTATPAVSAAPAASDTEECGDPNAPGTTAGQSP